ncbi:hypothetical protein [Persephonella sp.]|uniref:hypothetical protein n=1 Tax=Persephonella sp. TaxID=2060922 RepID=UPI0025F17434|nr:hypothetical protein [Persephonella sp.]
MWILLFLLMFICAEGKIIKKIQFDYARSKYIINLHDSPVYQMYWVKLDEGGYKLSGKAPDSCRFLTDMDIKEFSQLVKENYGHIYYNVSVRSINAVVMPNKEPILAKPFSPNINPTITQDIYEINSYLKEKVSTLIKKDPKVKERYKRLVDAFMESGFDRKEAERRALIETSKSIKVQIKKWIPDDKLPKNLLLVCNSSYVDITNKDINRYDLYPVTLKVKKGKSIKVEISKSDKFVELTLSFFPFLKKNKAVFLDLITENPPSVNIKGCKNGYIGVYIYPVEEYQPDYVSSFQTIDKGFYLSVIPYEPLKDVKVRLKLDYYCSNNKKEKISLLNPEKPDKSPLRSYIDAGYTHKKFLERYGIEKIKLKLKVISTDGYSSDIFSLELP